MESPKTRIYADIRHSEHALRVTDHTGNMPSSFHYPEDETWEGTLGRLGREVVGQLVSVDRRLFEHEQEHHDIVYLADELDTTKITLARGWQWTPIAKDQPSTYHSA